MYVWFGMETAKFGVLKYSQSDTVANIMLYECHIILQEEFEKTTTKKKNKLHFK